MGEHAAEEQQRQIVEPAKVLLAQRFVIALRFHPGDAKTIAMRAEAHPDQAEQAARKRIWLAHAPVLAPALPRATHPALVLSGHTHGGQILLPFVPALTPHGSGGFVSGRYDVTAGELYVSRGVGTSGIRARLRCPAELPIFVLRRGQPSRSRADRS